MNKKLLVSVFLCFFILTLGMFAQKKEEGVKTYEFLLRADVWGGLWELEPTDLVNPTEVYSETYHLGHVPPSPKTEAIFFDYVSMFHFSWTNLELRRVGLGADIVCSSDNIPAYEIRSGAWYIVKGETNCSPYGPTGTDRQGFSDRYPMWRDRHDWWVVVYKGTGVRVPEEEAIPIINKFMDNGFDIGYRVRAYFHGVSWVSLQFFGLEVTRLSKN